MVSIQYTQARRQCVVHCANFSNFPMVTDIPRPISAALLANSDLLGFPSPVALPFAAAFCESVRSDCLCAPTFEDACRLCTCVKTDLNSVVRSWMEETAIGRGRCCRRRNAKVSVREMIWLFGSAREAQYSYSFSPCDVPCRRFGSRWIIYKSPWVSVD
jgi:hypothetical protein